MDKSHDLLSSDSNTFLLIHDRMAIFRSDVVLLATKVLKDELLALRDLLIELEGINFEQTDLKTQRTVNFWIFTIYEK